MDNTTNKTGVQKELFANIRVYDYETVCGASSTEYPETFELDRSLLGDIKNQGNVGACVAEVISQLAENFYGKSMSEGYVYGRFRKNTTKGEGMVVSEALKFYKDLGTVPKDMFDILVEMPEIKSIVYGIPELDTFAKQYPIKGYTAINYADRTKRDNAIKDALTKQANGELNGYGLLAASDGYFSGGGHAIMLTGWNDKKDRYIFKNSWGEKYGDNGYGTIPKDEINSVYLIMFDDIQLPFNDVPEDAWYYSAVKNMYCAGLMNGKTENTFEPDTPITRAEMAVLMNRFSGMIDERFSIITKVMNEKLGL